MASVDLNKSKIDFLKDSLNYLENRIKFVDNKVSYLLALQGGLFLVFSFLIKEITFASDTNFIKITGYASIIVYFLLLIWFGFKCIQIIRPSISIFSSKIYLTQLDVKPYFLWYDNIDFNNPNKFLEDIDMINEDLIIKNYSRAIFTSHQLLHKKYPRYSDLTILFKQMFLYSIIITFTIIFFNIIHLSIRFFSSSINR